MTETSLRHAPYMISEFVGCKEEARMLNNLLTAEPYCANIRSGHTTLKQCRFNGVFFCLCAMNHFFVAPSICMSDRLTTR